MEIMDVLAVLPLPFETNLQHFNLVTQRWYNDPDDSNQTTGDVVLF